MPGLRVIGKTSSRLSIQETDNATSLQTHESGQKEEEMVAKDITMQMEDHIVHCNLAYLKQITQ